MEDFKKFSLKELEDKFEEISLILIKKKSYKDRKIIHVGLINLLIKFFKFEYPDMNRIPLNDLLSYLIETETNKKDIKKPEKQTKILPKFSRRKKTDTLIVAALELLIENGFDERDAVIKANKIIISKDEQYFHKLLNLYRSNLLHPNIKKLLYDLKQEAKKRTNTEDAATIYFKKAFQNLK